VLRNTAFHSIELRIKSTLIKLAKKCVFLTGLMQIHSKQLLDEVFVISRIIEVEVGVISRSRRLRLIILTGTSVILDITKTESSNCFIIH